MHARKPDLSEANLTMLMRVSTHLDVGWPAEDFRVYLDTKAGEAGFKNDAELAEAAGLNPSLLSRWRSGRAQPSRKSLKMLARPLRTTPVMLYIAAGLDEAEDLDVTAEADRWPAELHDLRTLYERFEAIGRADVVRRDIVRLVAGLRAELAELAKPGPNSRRRAG